MHFLNDDTFIDIDGEIIIPQEENQVGSWKLSDWIENMKSWPDFEDQLKKYGHQKVNRLLRENLYEGLAIHMEYYLLQRRELDSLVHSEPFMDLMPHANLMLTSHDFITRHFWPRLGWRWNGIPDADFLWGLFEYSLCYNNFKRIIEGTNIPSKNALLAKLGEVVQRKQVWLEDPYCPQKEIPSCVRRNAARTPQEVEEKEKDSEALKEFFAKIKNDLLSNFYRLILFQADMHIVLEKDTSLIKPYQNYMDSWDSYREQMSRPINTFQVLRLESPDYEPVFAGQVGRPRKAKKHAQKRGRGRPPKGLEFQSNL